MQSHPTIHKASFVASRKHVCRPAYETILFATELTRWQNPCNKIGQFFSISFLVHTKQQWQSFSNWASARTLAHEI